MREELQSRFWKKVDKRGPDDCWMWTASTANKGYGTIGIGGRGSGNIGAHRVSYLINKGEIPEGMLVCHTCDNPPCVNPSHLFLGTHKDNTQDMVKKGRSGPTNKPERMSRGEGHALRLHPELIKKGSQQTNSKLTEENILQIRDSKASQRSIAKIFGVNQALIYRIKARKSWRHIP